MKETLTLLRPYLRGLPIILLAMAIAVMAARKYLTYVTPMYESTLKLKLADISQGVPNSNLFKDLDVFVNTNKISAEIEMLKSRVLLGKVISTLGLTVEIKRVGKIRSVELYQNSPFTVAVIGLTEKAQNQPLTLQVNTDGAYTLGLPGQAAFQGTLGTSLPTPLGTFLLARNDTLLTAHPDMDIAGSYTLAFPHPEMMVERIAKQFDIIAVDKDVPVLRISCKDANPVKAAHLCNALAELYIDDYLGNRYEVANTTVNFLNQQINGMGSRLAGAEKDIQSYRDEQGITNIQQETETDLRKISQLKIQQTNLKMSLEAILSLEAYVQQGKGNFLDLAPNFEAFTDLLSTEIIKNIKALQAEKKDLLITYTPKHPKVQVIDAKIADLTAYLVESISNTRKNLEIKYKNISEDILAAEKTFIGVPGKERTMTVLRRDFNLYESSYNFLNNKRIEAEIAQAARVSFHRIISPAQVTHQPVSPNGTIITLLAAVLGMFGSIMLIFMVHQIKGKVNSPDAIEASSSIPVTLLTPKLHKTREAEQHFLKMANHLETKGLLLKESLLCFSSWRAPEGASFNNLNLARALAQQGRRVMLIDTENQLRLFTGHVPEGMEVFPGLWVSTLAFLPYHSFPRARLEAEIQARSAGAEITLLLNESLQTGLVATTLMSLSQVNLVSLDSRLTPRGRVTETEILRDEFSLPEMHFLLNRYGYTPSIFREGYTFLRRWLKRNHPNPLFAWE